MAPYIVAASTRRCMSSDVRIVIESDSEREAFISGQSVRVRSDGGICNIFQPKVATCHLPAEWNDRPQGTRPGRHLDTSTPCSPSALVPWCLVSS